MRRGPIFLTALTAMLLFAAGAGAQLTEPDSVIAIDPGEQLVVESTGAVLSGRWASRSTGPGVSSAVHLRRPWMASKGIGSLNIVMPSTKRAIQYLAADQYGRCKIPMVLQHGKRPHATVPITGWRAARVLSR